MTTRIRVTLLTTFFIFGLLTTLQAQDKYEFATISYQTNTKMIFISVDGKEFIEEKIELSKKDFSFYNCNPLLSKLSEFQDKGWEIISITPVALSTIIIHHAYLRKKK